MSVSNIVSKIENILSQNNKNPSFMSVDKMKAYHSVKMFDTICMRLIVKPRVKRIEIPSDFQYKLENININLSQYKETNGWLNLPFLNLTDFEYYIPLILDIYDYCEFVYNGEMFGCCSKYLECSNNLGCVQLDKAWHRGCFYRQNLAKGKVFYGVNKNI